MESSLAAGHDPGGKLNLFDVLTLAAAGGGTVLGYQIGREIAGTAGAVIGAGFGLVLGFLAMRFVTHIQFVRFVRRLQTTDTETLRANLEREYYISHLIIAILLSRGESEAQLRDYTLRLLLSPSSDQRWHGWRTLSLCFPQIAEALSGITPLRPGPADAARISQFFANQPTAPSAAV